MPRAVANFPAVSENVLKTNWSNIELSKQLDVEVKNEELSPEKNIPSKSIQNKYRAYDKIELIFLVPIVCYLYIHIFKSSEIKNSVIMKIEKIYKDRLFVFLIILISIMTIFLLNIEIKFLEIFEQKDLIYFK